MSVGRLVGRTYVGAVAGPDDETAVQHKLHVAGSRSPGQWKTRTRVSLFFSLYLLLPPFGISYSVPAVEMCSLMSDAGTIISALLTL